MHHPLYTFHTASSAHSIITTPPEVGHLPFAAQHSIYGCLGDSIIIAVEPLSFLLSDEAGVVAVVEGALVVHYRKQQVQVTVLLLRAAGRHQTGRHLTNTHNTHASTR